MGPLVLIAMLLSESAGLQQPLTLNTFVASHMVLARSPLKV